MADIGKIVVSLQKVTLLKTKQLLRITLLIVLFRHVLMINFNF